MSFNSAKSFTLSKISWIKKHISKIEKLKMTIFQPGLELNTKFSIIQFKFSFTEKIKSIQRNHLVEILIPDYFDIKCSNNQLIIKKK